MLRFQRMVRVKRDKMEQAKEYAKQINAHLSSHHLGANFRAFTGFLGPGFTMYFTHEFESLAGLESWMEKIHADADLSKLRAKEAELFVDGTIQDTLMRSLE